MSAPPALIPFHGEWETYVDEIYEVFLRTFVRRDLRFKGTRVTARRYPEDQGKGASFWHVISEAADAKNKNEDDRTPDLRRCERIAWIAWAIEGASDGKPGFSWWKNRRKREQCVVIWVEEHDFAVILAERSNYYVLKTAYCDLRPHRRKTFEKERRDYWRHQND